MKFSFVLKNETTGDVIKDISGDAEDVATIARKALYKIDAASRPGRKSNAAAPLEAEAAEADADELVAA